MANSPTYRAPSSVSKMLSSSLGSPPSHPHFTILPFLNSRRMFVKVLPLCSVGVLYCSTPSTLSRTGAVKTSPSGMLRSPQQGTTPTPLMLKRRSVGPGPLMCTWSVRFMRSTRGIAAFVMRA